MKEKEKNPEELSDVETGNLPEKELRVMIVKIIQEIRKSMDAQSKKVQEVYSNESENVRATKQ